MPCRPECFRDNTRQHLLQANRYAKAKKQEMKTIKLYRGESVKETDVELRINEIKQNGFSKPPHRTNIQKDLKPFLNQLYAQENLSSEQTQCKSIWVETKNGGHREYIEGFETTYFGDHTCAQFYAHRPSLSSEHIVPLIIEAELNIDETYIDANDFLYTVFKLIEPDNKLKIERQIETLKKIYGVKIKKYVHKVINHPKSDRNAICDLARCDNEIILAHTNNIEVIQGRMGVIFKTAILAKTPIKPSAIIKIEQIERNEFFVNPTITLNSILER